VLLFVDVEITRTIVPGRASVVDTVIELEDVDERLVFVEEADEFVDEEEINEFLDVEEAPSN